MASKRRVNLVRMLSLLIVTASAVVGMWTTMVDYVGPLIRSLSRLESVSDREKAATLLEGERFAEFIEFIRENTPADARIILPPNSPEQPVANVSFMQYFLFPRDIHNCGANEIEECTLRVRGENTFILATGAFPPVGLAELYKDFLPFDEDRGLYVPSAGLEAE